MAVAQCELLTVVAPTWRSRWVRLAVVSLVVVTACGPATDDPAFTSATAGSTATSEQPGLSVAARGDLEAAVLEKWAGAEGASAEVIAGVVSDVEAYAERHPLAPGTKRDSLEVLLWQMSCLEALAVPFQAFETGTGVGFFIPAVPEGAFRNYAADTACGLYPEVYGIVAPETPPGEEELRARYEHQLEVRECLVEHGYPTDQPPSFDAYVAGGGIWDAYSAIGSDHVVGPVDIRAVPEDLLESLPADAAQVLAARRDCPVRIVGIPLMPAP